MPELSRLWRAVVTAAVRMSPEREAELRAHHADCSSERCCIVEVLDALAAERATVAEQQKCTALAQKELQEQIERTQQVEVPHSSAAVLGYLLQVRGKDTVFTVGQDGFDAPYPTVDAAEAHATEFKNMDVTVFAAVRVGADGRIGS